MELQVTITLSDRLFALLEDKLPNLGHRIEKSITKELGAQARRDSNVAADVITAPEDQADNDKPRRSRRVIADLPPVKIAKAEAPVASIDETTQQGSHAPEQIPSDPQKMVEKIREIMHRTRIRLEGEDYKNNPGEGYKKYHRQLTSQFKQIAAILGFDKPSLINTPDKLAAFSAECDALIIGEDGNITPPPAPY